MKQRPSRSFFESLQQVKKTASRFSEKKVVTHIHRPQQKKPLKPGLYNAAPAGDTFMQSPVVKKSFKKAQGTWEKFRSWVGHHIQLLTLVTATIGVIMVGGFFIWIATMKIPTLDNFTERKVVSSTKIFDRTGEVLLYDLHENVRRTVVSGDTIDQKIKQAVIAVEDKDFYQHHGIRITSIIRAILANITPLRDGTQGGSTITQQVIKNTLLNSEKRISRKIKEWILALKLEKTMSKDEILALYLNEAPYGGAIYGIEEATRTFFGKSSNEVTLSEAAYLAAIPNAPTYFSPYGRNKDKLDQRKNLVLQKMLEQGYVTRDQFDAAKKEEVVFKPQSDSTGKALHFVDYIRSYLEETYGKDRLLTDGLKVTTTLDWKLQEQAEVIIRENALKNETTYNASNSALIALDPKTGQILSMVGSRDYTDTDIDGQFNVTLAKRQPGSAFKPIVYARAFERGYRPETVVFDLPTQFSSSCDPFSRQTGGGCYAPDNYDGKFLGPISLRSALGQSRNIPAVQLLYLVGISDALQFAKQLGITTLNQSPEHYGLSLVLGGGETTLLELTSVYGVLANDGVRVPPTGILKVEDLQGNILEEYKPTPGAQVVSADAARMVSSVLSDNDARTPLFGASSGLFFPGRQVAAKSGTTNDNKDAWLVGYTPNIAVGVWSGNNDNKPMQKGSSMSIPAWRSVMDTALANLPNTPFGGYSAAPQTVPPVIRGKWWGGESYFTDTISGKLATEFTPPETKKEHVIINPHNILYWINKGNLNASQPGIGLSDGQYRNWEAVFQNWVTTNGLGNVEQPGPKPTEYDDVHKPEFQPVVTITSPNTENSVIFNQENTITATATGPQQIKKYEFYANNTLIGTVEGESASLVWTPAEILSVPGTITIKVIAIDNIYNRGENSIQVLTQ